MSEIVNTSGYWRTQNGALALMLATAGCEMAKPPVENRYRPETLRKLGVSSATEAEAKGLPGQVTYFFASSDLLKTLLKEWREMEELIEKLELRTITPEEFASLDVDVSEREFARVAFQILKNRRPFVNLWKTRAALFETKTGPKSFKVISTNASEQTKKDMGF